MKKVTKLDIELTVEERNLIFMGYKNVIGDMRKSWRVLSLIEWKKTQKENEKIEQDQRVQEEVEKDLTDICHDIMIVIDEHLILSFIADKFFVFYYRTKGYYYQ